MHYQIHLTNIKLPMLVEADTMEHIGSMLVLYKANTAVAAISLSELQCVIEVEASSVPPKEDFLDQQTELQTLKVEHKALQLKNNSLWEDRRKALDSEQAAITEMKIMERHVGTLALSTVGLAIVAIALTLKLVFWS